MENEVTDQNMIASIPDVFPFRIFENWRKKKYIKFYTHTSKNTHKYTYT